MTENDPTAHENSGIPTYGEQAAQPVTPGADSEQNTPPRGIPVSGEHQPYAAPSPWSAHGAQAPQPQVPQQPQTPQTPQTQTGPYGQAYGIGQQHAQPGVHGTAVYGAGQPQPPKKSGPGKLVAGVAVLALLIGGGAGALGGYLTAQTAPGSSSYNALDAPKPALQTGNAPAGSTEAVAAKVSPSVVELKVSGAQGAGEGSGFVLSPDGYILTNNHVVQVAVNGGQIQALFSDGKTAPATVIGRDPTTDIAVVKVSGMSGLTPVELGRSDDLKVGQGVVAIGSPFDLAGTVTSGIVSALHRPVRAGGSNGDQATVMDAIQTDAAINPGNSGGPLSNSAGQVIGINSAIYSPQSGGAGGQQAQGGNVGIGFSIPIDQARRTADDIIKTGKATQTFIGAQVSDAQNGGAQIGTITPGSPAEQGGLKAGDVVVNIDGRPIPNSDALIAAIRTRAPNEKIKLTLADSRVVQITLGGQPVPVN